jgi:hypothetical protein
VAQVYVRRLQVLAKYAKRDGLRNRSADGSILTDLRRALVLFQVFIRTGACDSFQSSDDFWWKD